MTKGTVGAAGAALLALLATQHHAVMSLLLLGGMGGAAGAGMMDGRPVVGWTMLAASAAMAGVAVVRVWRHRRSSSARYVGLASAALAIGVLVWSIARLTL
jgi:hypothetical protein